MDTSEILANVGKHIVLNKKESDYFISLLSYQSLSRKEFVIKEGNLCTSICYVQNGALRAYYKDTGGNDHIIMLAINDWWITDMYSFISQQPAMLSIDALSDSNIIHLRKKDLDKLYLQVPKFECFFRIIMQHAYIREQLRVIQNLSLPAEERYSNFILKYPQFMQRIPLKYIASYLGITPEFLSVLRKKRKRH